MKTSEKANIHNQHWLTCLARSAHRGRIKLLRGYVSKSSASLNPLTITQLACKRPRGRSRTALRGAMAQPGAHQLVVRTRIIGASVSEAPSCGLDGRAVMHDIYIYIRPAPATAHARRNAQT